jgi:hypothetical protein
MTIDKSNLRSNDTDCGDVLFDHFLVILEGNSSPSKGVWETLTKQDET